MRNRTHFAFLQIVMSFPFECFNVVLRFRNVTFGFRFVLSVLTRTFLDLFHGNGVRLHVIVQLFFGLGQLFDLVLVNADRLFDHIELFFKGDNRLITLLDSRFELLDLEGHRN